MYDSHGDKQKKGIIPRAMRSEARIAVGAL
jgi:hypothetical protein